MKNIQETVKQIGPLVKCQNMLVLSATEIALTRLDAKKLNSFVATVAKDHEKWLKARQTISHAQIAKIDRIRVLAKEKMLNNEESSFNIFYRALRIKNKKNQISMLKDLQGQVLQELDAMAQAMLQHLSPIISLEEEKS